MTLSSSKAGTFGGRVAALAAAALLALLVAPAAEAQTYSVLHAFTGSPDGASPHAIIRDSHGTIYGTTMGGGLATCVSSPAFECGAVFQVKKNGKEKILYAFQGLADGASPIAGLARDEAGDLYGATEGNGYIGAPSTLFKLDPKGRFTVLHAFTGQADGCCATAAPVLDAQGNLYGTVGNGGDNSCDGGAGCGVVYKVDVSGNFSVLHTFEMSDGALPIGNLSIDAGGNLYGTTVLGGDLTCQPPTGCGIVFKIDPSGNETILHQFTGGSDGASPLYGVTLDAKGNLFGAALAGGGAKCSLPHGCGTIFEVTNKGNFSVRYAFESQNNATPGYSALVLDGKGNLYGTKPYDGTQNTGYIFELDTKGNFTTVYNFVNQQTNGGSPVNIIRESDGTFYGSMSSYGDPQISGCCGTIFELKP